MIVLDANILVRAVLGRRAMSILETYAAHGIRFFAPESAFDDAATHLPEVLAKRGKSSAGLAEALEYLRQIIEPVEQDFLNLFESAARARLRGRDEDDWPVLAAALGLRCPIWTEDADFFGTGVAVWTTSRVEIYLQAQAEARQELADE